MSDEARPTTSKGFQELPEWTPWAVFALVMAGALALILRHGLGAALIVLAGATLVLCIWLAFRAVQSVAEPDDFAVLIDLPPTPAQTRKVTALRALKDLEFEKSLGNLNEADFAELDARYREEAKLAMREVDEERAELRGRAELLAQKAIETEPEVAEDSVEEAPKQAAKKQAVSESIPPSKDPTPTPAAAPASIRARGDKVVACTECETKNEPDARFCKQCGAKMEVSS